MIYLDYSATTPVSLEALNAYIQVSKNFIGSVSSNNLLGNKSNELLKLATRDIGSMFGILENEIIYTSGASEANNMALIGVSLANHKNGRHIIVSRLEHPTVYVMCDYLASIGFEISYVKNDEDGLISFDDLRSLIRPDTILVSICAVNHETGVRQPLKMLRQIIKKENENTLFHSDLSQALGKMVINFKDIDLGSVSSHKIYGPKGIGFLYKSGDIKIQPLLYGSKKFPDYKPGEVSLPLVIAMKEALKNSIKDIDKKERYINLLNERIVNKLKTLEGIKINKTKYSIPHILNISFDKVSSMTMANTLSNNEIYVSCNNTGEVSSSVLAIYNDLNRSKKTLRISISHLTTVTEINKFLYVFESEYRNLSSIIF